MDSPRAKFGVKMYCPNCGRQGTTEQARFCGKCGTPLASPDAAAEAQIVTLQTPWYFSTPFLIFTFLLLTPIWTILILADRRRGIGLKAFSVLIWVVPVATFLAFETFGGK